MSGESTIKQKVKPTMTDTQDFLEHYGVLGMKWGVRKDRGALQGISGSTSRDAKRDAKEYARAKAFYGEGAGNRRKAIRNTVDAKSKRDANYKKSFDYHLDQQDMAKHTSKARGERRRKDVSNTTAKTARGIKNLVLQTGAPVSLGAIALYGAYKNPTINAKVKDILANSSRFVKREWKTAKNYVDGKRFVDFITNRG